MFFSRSMCDRNRRGTGRALPLWLAFLILPLFAAAPAAAQTPQAVNISATHIMMSSVDQGDGTYAVTYEVTLTNESSTDLNTVSLTPLSDKLRSFDEASSPLDTASLAAGASVTVTWIATQLSSGDDAPDAYPISFYGSATDAVGAAVTVAAMSMGDTGQ